MNLIDLIGNRNKKVFTIVENDDEELRTQNVTFYDVENRIEKEEYSFYNKDSSKFD